jgi:hypothetical protein
MHIVLFYITRFTWGNKMKRIFLTLCLFIALATVYNAEAFYNCVDNDGNSIITDNPPADAICESPGGNNKSATGENYIENQRIIIKLNNLERKSNKSGLTSSEIEQQTQLLEDLSRSDTENARRRIINILENLESKSIAGGLTNIERDQQTRLIQLQRSLRKRPIKSAVESRSTQNETGSETIRQQSDTASQQEKKDDETKSQKGEVKRLLKIPRLGN